MSHSSVLISQGESPKYIQKQLRHASIEMTFDGYGHFFPDTNREVARRLDETLFGGKADRPGDFGKNFGHILASEPAETV